jgi:L-phenylalanine/L-methionine N-acetyltransferase
MDTIAIRHLEPADIPQVHALYAEPHAYADTLQLPFQPVAAWEDKLGGSRPGFVCLVAVRGDEVLGQLGLEASQSPRRRHVASFGMGVKASARRLGAGSALVEAAIDLYRKHGFVVEGTCRNYAWRDGRYVDAHLMARVAS